jgi:hypothetical protein
MLSIVSSRPYTGRPGACRLGVELEAGIEILPLLACELGLTSPLGVVRARLNEGEGGPAAPQAPGEGDGGTGLPLWLTLPLPLVMTLSARCRF